MCGITGIYPFNEVGKFHSINLQSSIDALTHRGPDSQGSELTKTANFGHTRLSIIDLSSDANQPMKDGSGRYVLSFNGEIYNFREIQTRLKSAGVSFKSNSDTEVLLYQLIHKGPEGLNELNGFFSLAFYDIHEERLILARDRFGIKPLLYFADSDKVVFSSELHSLTKYGLPKKLDQDALYLYFLLNYIPAPYSIYSGVKKLEPGHYIQIKNKHFDIRKWYKPLPAEGEPHPHEELQKKAKRIRELLFESVEMRLVSDVPLGGFLSGGIDSAIISFIANSIAPGFKTFSVSLENGGYLDESREAEFMADFLKTEHIPLKLNAEFFKDSMDRIFMRSNEPFADSSAIAVQAISRKAREHITVALSGDGADEVFAGYYKYQAFMRSFSPGIKEKLVNSAFPITSLFKGNREGMFGNLIRRINKYARAARLPNDQRYWQWSSPVGVNWPDEILKVSNAEDHDKILNSLTPNSSPQTLNEVLQNDLDLVLPDDMLYKVDLSSMINSLEVRVPFLDHHVVEYVSRIPGNMKASLGKNKLLLREAFKNDLPKEVFARPKKGFEIPINSWLSSELLEPVQEKWLSEKNNPLEEFVNMNELKKLKEDITNKRGDNSAEKAWALISLHEFLSREEKVTK